MNRRRFLSTVALGGVVGSAGCLGTGGEVITSVRQTITVEPGSGWVEEIPDDGGQIAYITRARRPYDVYFFTSDEQIKQYRAYLAGESPDETPAGDQDIGRTATESSGDYMAKTDDDGGRQPIDADGPYYFVLDNSDYPASGAYPAEDAPKNRRIFLDLSVTARQLPLPF